MSLNKSILVTWGLVWLWFVFAYVQSICSEIETWNHNCRIEKMLIMLAAVGFMIFLVIMIGIIAVAIVMAWGL